MCVCVCVCVCVCESGWREQRREKESWCKGGGEDRQESGEGSKVKRKGRVGCGSSLQVMSFNWRYTHVQYVHIIIHVHVIIP